MKTAVLFNFDDEINTKKYVEIENSNYFNK